jgi:hypothetical protein
MAKRRKKKHRRPQSHETPRLRLTNPSGQGDDPDRAAVLEQLPAWARLLRTRQGIVVGVAFVGAIIAFNVLGRVAGPATAGAILIGIGLAMRAADMRERRVRKRLAEAPEPSASTRT